MPSTVIGNAKEPESMGMQDGIGEATRLTNAGRLMEATDLIQRTLGNSGRVGGVSPGTQQDASEKRGNFDRIFESFSARKETGSDFGSESSASPLGGKLFDLPQNLLDLPTGLPGSSQLRVPEPPTVDISEGGRFVSGSFTNAAGTRGYKLYIPSGIEGESLPLVVMLHGCTQNPDDFAAGTRMNTLAEEGKFFVLYPEQSNGANMQKCWNWFQAGDQLRDRGEPSIIAGITHQIAATQPIDTSRIYVTGLSAGAAMAVVMGETYPDLYAAVGVHSGLPYGAARDMPSAFQAMQGGGPSRGVSRVPTIVFHGDRDSTVNQRNGQQVLRRWVAPGSGGEDANVKPLVTVKKGQVSNGHSYTRSTYHDAGGQPVAEGWSIHGAGHAWAGGDPRGSYTDSRGPDASAEMMRFFLEHPRR
ncbi:MAG: PHB depolymerase family esterase [Rubrobacteraceae bacterium]